MGGGVNHPNKATWAHSFVAYRGLMHRITHSSVAGRSLFFSRGARVFEYLSAVPSGCVKRMIASDGHLGKLDAG